MKKTCFKFLLILGALFTLVTQVYADEYIVSNPNTNYQAVIKKLEADLAKNPNSYETYCMLGINYGLAGNGQKAEQILKEAVKKFPDRWNAYTFLGDIKRSQHMTAVAKEYYEKAMSMPSMPQEGRKYYKKLIASMIEEQKAYESAPSVNQLKKTNITLNLDTKKWEQAYLKGTEKNWILEYGLKGEDVVNYKWSKLITVNFFDSKEYGFTPQVFCDRFLGLLKDQANSMNQKFNYKILSSDTNNIYLEWNILKRNECEICRIYKHPKGLYVIHYAQKTPTFTPEERKNVMALLKSAQVSK